MRVSCLSVMCLLLLWQRALADEESAEVTTEKTAGLCDCVCGQYRRGGKIVGGEEARVHEFPWMVYFKYRSTFVCGGTLITDRHVLTAAHCVYRMPKKHVTVSIGDHNRNIRSSEVQTRKARRISPHSQFNLSSFDHDIAVLELDQPVTLSEAARVACLPLSDDEDYSGRMATVAGWGRLSEDHSSKKPESLQKVSVPMMSQDECQANGYLGKISKNMICAGFENGKKDACQGDSGGPLHATINNTTEVIGIVSWGDGCARPKHPGVYTRVGRYLEWIDEQLDGECRCTRRQGHGHRTPRTMEPQY